MDSRSEEGIAKQRRAAHEPPWITMGPASRMQDLPDVAIVIAHLARRYFGKGRLQEPNSLFGELKCLHEVLITVDAFQFRLLQQIKLQLVSHQSTNATKALAELVAFLRLIGDELQLCAIVLVV